MHREQLEKCKNLLNWLFYWELSLFTTWKTIRTSIWPHSRKQRQSLEPSTVSSSVLVDTRAAVIRATTHWSVNKQVLNQRTGKEKILAVLEVQGHYSPWEIGRSSLEIEPSQPNQSVWLSLELIQGKALFPQHCPHCYDQLLSVRVPPRTHCAERNYFP